MREVKPSVSGLEDRALLSHTPFAAGSPAAAQSYVNNLYRELLNRNADAASLAKLSGELETGATTPSKIVKGIMNGKEFLANEVNFVYEKVLGRTPDQQGLASSMKLLSNGGTLNSLELKLVSSKEFYSDAGNSSQGYVAALYSEFLDRKPDAAANNLVAELNSGVSPSKIAGEIINSKEAADLAVSQLYGSYFDRSTDNAAQGYADMLVQTKGAAYDQVIAGFATSNEFIARATKPS